MIKYKNCVDSLCVRVVISYYHIKKGTAVMSFYAIISLAVISIITAVITVAGVISDNAYLVAGEHKKSA